MRSIMEKYVWSYIGAQLAVAALCSLAALLLSGCHTTNSNWINAPSDIEEISYNTAADVKACMKNYGLPIKDGHPSETKIEYVAGDQYKAPLGWSWIFIYSGGQLRVCGLTWGDDKIQLATDPNKKPGTWNADVHRHEWGHVWQSYSRISGPVHPKEEAYLKCLPIWRMPRNLSASRVGVSSNTVVISVLRDDGTIDDIIVDRSEVEIIDHINKH
jgi:hypothetical protein